LVINGLRRKGGAGLDGGLKKGVKIGRFGRQNALFPKLFSFLQICFFCIEAVFPQCLQGFF
jgi:hypothetical protein